MNPSNYELHKAVEKVNLETVKTLPGQRADINAPTEKKNV